MVWAGCCHVTNIAGTITRERLQHCHAPRDNWFTFVLSRTRCHEIQILKLRGYMFCSNCQAVLPKESPWSGAGEEAEGRCCSECSERLREERGRARSVVMEVLDRLRLEEKMADEEKRRAEEEMRAVMGKLAALQKSLLSEQSRVKKLLNSKDKLIR